MTSCEIEMKSLLGTQERADELREKLKAVDPRTRLVSRNKQLNHYFVGGDTAVLYDKLFPHLSEEKRSGLQSIIKKGSDFSIRTRRIDEQNPLIVLKASLDAGTSHNTVSRLEFESEISGMTLEQLDRVLLESGFSYQAKWSREREEYQCGDVSVCFDKNAGYGYVAEFEKVVPDGSHIESARKALEEFMERLGVSELPQERLERMFAHYNEHWPEYYGTSKTFVVE